MGTARQLNSTSTEKEEQLTINLVRGNALDSTILPTRSESFGSYVE